MLKGIDVSSHDVGDAPWFTDNTENAYNDSDFVIVKKTQGVTYVFKDSDALLNRAQNDGKLLGVYHYAGGNDPEREAEFFYSECREWVGKAICCLDFEEYQNAGWDDSDWARRFVDRFHDMSGTWPLIYIQASAIHRVENCADVCGLWVAGYPDNRNSWDMPNFRYDVSPWEAYTLWQYTSSNEKTDRNFAQLDAAGWQSIADGNGAVIAPEHPVSDNPTKDLQLWLNGAYYQNLEIDGVWGPLTHKGCVKAYQTELNKQFQAGIAVDGLFGEATFNASVNVRYSAQGNLTLLLQHVLYEYGMDIDWFDGIFGANTYACVMDYQHMANLDVDGIAGPVTWQSLLGNV